MAVVKCPRCSEALNCPDDFQGQLTCPVCSAKMTMKPKPKPQRKANLLDDEADAAMQSPRRKPKKSNSAAIAVLFIAIVVVLAICGTVSYVMMQSAERAKKRLDEISKRIAALESSKAKLAQELEECQRIDAKNEAELAAKRKAVIDSVQPVRSSNIDRSTFPGEIAYQAEQRRLPHLQALAIAKMQDDLAKLEVVYADKAVDVGDRKLAILRQITDIELEIFTLIDERQAIENGNGTQAR